jgi:hypothetical protein
LTLDAKYVPEFLKNMWQEHKNRKESLFEFVASCNEYITLQEAYALPSSDRVMYYNMIRKKIKETEKNKQ